MNWTEREWDNVITISQVSDQDTKLDQIVILVTYNQSRYLVTPHLSPLQPRGLAPAPDIIEIEFKPVPAD